MIKYLAVMVLFVSIASTACLKTAVETNTAGNNSNTSGTPNSNANPNTKASDVQPENKSGTAGPGEKIFFGTIDDRSFEMKLARNGDKLSGTYVYLGIGEPLNLSGSIDGTGKFVLQETDESGRKTGQWQGTWQHESGRTSISGEFMTPNNVARTSNFLADEQIIEFTNGQALVTKILKEENKKENSLVTANYPEISGVDPSTAAEFNSLTKKMVAGYGEKFKKALAENPLPPGEKDRKTASNTTYDIELANNDLVSLLFTDEVDLGGAHPSSISDSLNYDLKNNRELKLADIFEPNSDYLKILSDYCTAELKKKGLGDEDMISEGASPKEENYDIWNPDKKGLIIYFDTYQVASYAEGPQTITVPYDKLKDILRQDSLVTAVMK